MKWSLILTVCALCFFSDAALANVATVYELNGKASVTRNSDTQRVMVGMKIQKGDALTVAPSSRMQLQLADGSTVSLGANSQMNMDAFTGDGAKPKDGAVLHSVKGFFRYVSGARRTKRSFTTPVGAIGIRGTDVFWEVKDSGVTVVGLVKCCVDVSSDGGSVAMDKPNTFSKITAADASPTEPETCNPAWLKKVKAALGASDPFFDAI